MHPRGRTASGSAPRARLLAAACCGLAVGAAAAACAGQGDTPSGTPTAVVSLQASIAPAPAAPFSLVPLPPGTAMRGCAASATREAPSTVTPRSRGAGPNDAGPPRPRSPDPNDILDFPTDLPDGPLPQPSDDAAERRRKALQPSPVPRRGEVPAAAIPAAEACVRQLQMELTLLGASGNLQAAAVEAVLLRAGLRDPVVEPGPAFAASTGSACVVGSFTGTEPSLAIAPLLAAGACKP